MKSSRKKYLLTVLVLSFSTLAFADPETVDFRTLMEGTSTLWVPLVTDYPFQTFTPDGYWEDDETWSKDPDFDEAEHKWVPPCDNNTNGIPDVIEFAVLSEIFADTGHPLHTELHEAYKANVTQVQTDLGALQDKLAPDFKYIMGAYATLGDGDYQSLVISNVRYGWGFEGSWGIVATAVYNIDDFGGLWRPAEGAAPDEALYQRKASLVAACGDADGDGVTNLGEFYGNGGVYTGAALDPFLDPPDDDMTNSLGAETVYVAAALDTGTTTDGGDPAEVCTGESSGGWAWGENIWYYPENGYVYVAGPNMPWTPGRYWAQNLFTIGSEKAAVVGELASIDSEDLQNWLVANVLTVVDDTMWTGGTDQAQEGNWKWIATGVQFWSGAADGSAVGGAYTNWNGGEPNDSSGEDCMEIRKEGGWNDQGDDRFRPVLIEFSNEGAGYADSNGNGFPDWWETYLPAPPGVHAAFSAVPTSGDVPLTVQFTDLSDGAGEIITDWLWDFGDGATSTQQNPQHTYIATQPPGRFYTVSLTVTTINGSKTHTKVNYIAVDFVCEFDGELTSQGELLHAAITSDTDPVSPELKLVFDQLGIDSWQEWDIEGLNAYPPTVPGDGLPDAAQMALVEYILCHSTLPAQAPAYAGMIANKALFLYDAAVLTATYPELNWLTAYADLFAGMIGSSQRMKDTCDDIILTLTEGATGLPNYSCYIIFESGGSEIFSADADPDGDQYNNLSEYDIVTADGYGNDIFVLAAIDPGIPFDPPLGIPAAGLIGLGLLAGSLLTAAAFALRKK